MPTATKNGKTHGSPVLDEPAVKGTKIKTDRFSAAVVETQDEIEAAKAAVASSRSKKPAAAVETIEEITIPEMQIQQIVFRIEGTTSLITHRWAEKAKEMMRVKQQKGAKLAREAKVPKDDFEEATYYIDKNPKAPRYGFPVNAIKNAAVEAAMALDVKKAQMRRAFHVVADARTEDGDLIEIFCEKRVMREDMVRIGMGTADLRYRPEFINWHADIKIRYDARQISASQLVSLLNQAGFSVGIGEWRVERDGQNGQFQVAAINP